MIPLLDLKEQQSTIKEEIDAAIARVFESGWFILGPEVEAFEQEFAQYCGTSFAVGVGSGTEALHLALLSFGVGAGDEVLTVPNTAVATICAINFAGAKPVFVDVDPETCNMDPAKVESKITKRTKAIIPVHLYGQPVDMNPLLDIARRHALRVVEDACQAHGSEYKGKRTGSIGDAGCFSFYPSKNLGAYGDGGMVVTSDAGVADRLHLLRQYGWRRRDYSETKGFNSRLDELQAASLRVKLRHLDDWNAARRRIAALYNELFAGTEVVRPVEKPFCKSNWHLYVVKADRRAELQAHLNANGIASGVHYPTPIYLQEAYLDLGIPSGTCPVAEELSSKILTLPMYPELKDKQIREIVGAIERFS